MDLFLQASREKLRFQTSKGSLAVEQLWDLSLTSLNSLYKQISSQAQPKAEGLFEEETVSPTDQLRLDIIKTVFVTRQVEIKQKEQLEAKKSNNKLIDDLIKQKELESLSNKSIEELQALKK